MMKFFYITASLAIFTSLKITALCASSRTLDNSPSIKPENLEKNNARSILEIDLKSCLCQDATWSCGIAISKSTILKVPSCPRDQVYCCKGETLHDKDNLRPSEPDISETSMDSNYDNDEELKEEGEGQGRTFHDNFNDDLEDENNGGEDFTEDEEYRKDYPSLPAENEEEEQPEDDEDLLMMEKSDKPLSPKIRVVPVSKIEKVIYDDDNHSSLKSPPKPSKRCRCKENGSCPETFIDYRFGFHCPHNTTRCCEPEPQVQEEMEETGRHIFATGPEDRVCHCLPKSECQDPTVTKDSGRATSLLCPGDLVQCCVRQAEERKDDIFSPQPIPLPALKIPIAEFPEEGQGQGHGHEGSLGIVPVPPTPSLPTQYNYQSPGQYSGSGGYYYPPQAPSRPISQWAPSSNYRNNYENHNTYGNNYDNHRTATFNQDDSRTIDSDSLFDKISRIIG